MTTRKFSDPAAAQQTHQGPLDCYIDLFAQRLSEQQFSSQSVRAQVLQVANLSRWLHARKLKAEELTVTAIDAHCCEQRPGLPLRQGHRAALHRLLGILRERGVCPEDVAPSALGPRQRVEEDFKRFLAVERGLSPATLVNYVPFISQLLMERFGRGPIRLARLRATDIIGFVQRHAHDFCPGRTKLMLTALRSFLRHLQLRGDIGAELAACVPCVPRWTLTEVPKFLPPGAVQQVLTHCDRRSATGMRDYAILLLLARLGLRAGEVVSLTLDDIDWRAGQLTLHCKGRRSAQVPLIAEVGDALARYVQHGRPRCATRRVFIRGHAPRVSFANSSAICCIVERALARAGVQSARKGSHLFRHTLATQMLRHGASLGEIGQVLRHRHPDTTLIYAKVDLRALRTLAIAWPGGVR
jgi:site-specific recombinase XerD